MQNTAQGLDSSDPARTDDTTTLILDFLTWLAAGPRPYPGVMEVWRTSCPRLTVWEDAIDLGYVARRTDGAGRILVHITSVGQDRLTGSGPPPLGCTFSHPPQPAPR